MADVKITALTVLTAADPINDAIPIVDVSNPIMAASGTTSRISINNILGASGTATLASATITGAATVGTTLGVTGTSTLASANVSGLLGVGTVSPDASFKATLSGLYGLRVQSADTNNSAINFGSDTSAGYSFIDTTKTGSGSFLPLRFSTSDTERIRISTAGDVTISTGNLVIGTAAKGIDFTTSADGSGTVTAELLNDYEEGTWTIGLEFGGASTSMTTNANTGKYTKIGRQVTVTGYLALTNKGSATGDALITGLPFLINSYGGLSIYLAQITFADFPMGYSNNGTSTIPLKECTNAGVVSSLTNSDFANNSEIIFTMTYNA